MVKTFSIGGQSVELLATASTPIRFKAAFHEDVMAAINKLDTNDVSDAVTELTAKLAFVMNKQAIAMKSNTQVIINPDEFLDWLDQFPGGFSFTRATKQILGFYLKEQKGDSVSKKGQGQSSEK